jgi:ubiquilin
MSLIQDEDILSVYKIQTNHTIHMVKGVSRPSGASDSSTAPAPQQLPTMQTGQNVHDPLTQLNGHQGFGLMAGLNPFGEMGVNPNDPNMVRVFFLYPCVCYFDRLLWNVDPDAIHAQLAPIYATNVFFDEQPSDR